MPLSTAQKVAVLFASQYTGLLDLVPSAAAAYSVARKLRAAYSGSAFRIRRSSDDAEQDIGFTGAGAVDTAAAAAFIGGGSGFIKTLYDQSGNGRDASQATAGNQPAYVASVKGTSPGMRFDGATSTRRLRTSAFTANQPNTVLVAVKLTSVTQNTRVVQGLGSSAGGLVYNNSGNFDLFAGTALVGPAQDTNWKLRLAMFNGASSEQRINGASVATGAAGAAAYNGLEIGANNDGAGNLLIGDVLEVILWNALLSAGQQVSVENNTNTFYALY